MRLMFVLGLLSCAVVAKSKDIHMTEEQKKMAEMLHNNCVQESVVTEDIFQAAARGDFKDDEKLKCYMKCLLVQTGVFSEEDMSLDIEAMVEMVPDVVKEPTTKAVEKCTPLHGDNACEMAFNLYKCFFEFDPEKNKPSLAQP